MALIARVVGGLLLAGAGAAFVYWAWLLSEAFGVLVLGVVLLLAAGVVLQSQVRR